MADAGHHPQPAQDRGGDRQCPPHPGAAATRTARSTAGSRRIIRGRATEWVKLFRKTFRFTGGEIVSEFLMSLGYLPGAHEPDCPVYARIAALVAALGTSGGIIPMPNRDIALAGQIDALIVPRYV